MWAELLEIAGTGRGFFSARLDDGILVEERGVWNEEQDSMEETDGSNAERRDGDDPSACGGSSGKGAGGGGGCGFGFGENGECAVYGQREGANCDTRDRGTG